MQFITSKTTDIRVGDIVTGYNEGYFRVLKIIPRYCTADLQKYSHYKGVILGAEINALVEVTGFANKEFKPFKRPRAKKQFDIGYCKRITPEVIQKELEVLTERYQRAILLFRQHYEEVENATLEHTP